MHSQRDTSPLEPKVLDRTSPLPLYYQMRTHIYQQVVSGRLSPGDHLPPLREIAEHYSVSLAVVRQTMATLEQEGIVDTHQGRGVFVRGQGKRFSLPLLAGQVYGSAADLGIVLTLRVLAREIVDCPVLLQQRTGLHAQDRLIHLVKVRLANNVPVLLADAYFPYPACADLMAPDVDAEGANRVLEELIYPRIHVSENFASARLADDEEARLLGIGPGSPIQVFEGWSHDVSANLIQYYIARAPSHRIRFGVQFDKLEIVT